MLESFKEYEKKMMMAICSLSTVDQKRRIKILLPLSAINLVLCDEKSVKS